MVDYRTMGDRNSFEEKVKIIMSDGKSRHDAERYLKTEMVTIYERKEFEDWFKRYDEEWEVEDDKEDYRRMIRDGIPMEDYGVTTYNGKLYYIEYWR